MIEQAEQASGAKSCSLVVCVDGESGTDLRPGGYSGGMHLVELECYWVPSVTPGKAKLKHQMVEALLWLGDSGGWSIIPCLWEATH